MGQQFSSVTPPPLPDPNSPSPPKPTNPDEEPRVNPNLQPQKVPINPTPLSATQEQQVRDIYYKRVRTTCQKEIEGVFYQLDGIFGVFFSSILILFWVYTELM
jgi:hypothetical protein